MAYSAKIIQRTDAVRQDGTAALCLQLIIFRKRKVLPLDIWVKPTEFLPEVPEVRLERKGREWKELEGKYNGALMLALVKAQNIFADAHYAGRVLDIAAFQERYSNGHLMKDFTAFIQQQIEKETGLLASSTTEDNYKVLNRLRGFRKQVFFADVTPDFLRDFQKHLRKKLAPNTVASTLKGIRKFLHLAIGEMPQLEHKLPKIKVQWANTDPVWLEPTELTTLLDLYRRQELDETRQRILRGFLFQCFTGLRYGDAAALGKDNVAGSYLVFQMEKTRRTKMLHRVPLNSIAIGLLRDEISTERSGKLLRFYKDIHAYNRCLKSVAAYAGIDKNLTSHVGRHTFATCYLIAGGKVERLSRLLGHSSLEMTMRYVHLVEEYTEGEMEAFAQSFQLGTVA